MGFVAEAMLLTKTNNFGAAAKLLESHVNDSALKQSSKIGLMSWIAECYLKSEEKAQAAKWYELAGRAALECKDIPRYEKIKRAKEEFEHAMTYYEAVNDFNGMGRMASMKYGLDPSL